MPDFTMCKATGCPVKNLCHRYRAAPDLVQPYFQAPFDHKNQRCNAFKAIGLVPVMSLEDAEKFWSQHV
jgi:hypothetical protein